VLKAKRRLRLVACAVGLLAAVAAASILLPAACRHWPGAPYVDVVESPPPEVTGPLRAAHPGAASISPVYRKHLEERGGRYRVVRQWFLFEDAAGRAHRAEIDEAGALSVTPVEFPDALPAELHARFFESRSAMAGGGRVSGRVWRFVDAGTGETRYEFEFDVGDRRGLGAISASGRTSSAYEFVATPE